MFIIITQEPNPYYDEEPRQNEVPLSAQRRVEQIAKQRSIYSCHQKTFKKWLLVKVQLTLFCYFFYKPL